MQIRIIIILIIRIKIKKKKKKEEIITYPLNNEKWRTIEEVRGGWGVGGKKKRSESIKKRK